MLAVAALIVFVIAAVLKLAGSHTNILQWLIIIGGILISAHAIWGWGSGRYWGPGRPAV
jgi:hypothetical protein